MEKTKDKKYQPVVYVNWEESERNWGIQPDGCSLHLKEDDFREFEKEYWDSMPDKVPDEYSRPADRPILAYASRKLYEKIRGSSGLRLSEAQEIKEMKNRDLVRDKETVRSLLFKNTVKEIHKLTANSKPMNGENYG
jgi:hypothetical protein